MKTLLAAGVATLALSTTATAQDEKHFDGAYIGAEAGYQDSGNGLNGLYYGTTLGFRKQTSNNLVYGIEGNLGKANIDFGGFDNVIDNQWSVQGTIGWAFGDEKRDLLTIGAGYAGLKVSIAGFSNTGDGISSFIGYERAIGDKFSFRMRVTSYDAFDTFIGTGGFSFRF